MTNLIVTFLILPKRLRMGAKIYAIAKHKWRKQGTLCPLFLDVNNSVMELEISYLEYCLWFAQQSQVSATTQAAVLLSVTFQTHTTNWKNNFFRIFKIMWGDKSFRTE